MRILGVDPGSRIMGFGIVDAEGSRIRHVDSGVIKLGKSDLDLSIRMHRIHIELSKIVEKYGPETMAIEDVFHGKNVRSLVRIGESRGVAMLVAAAAGMDVFHYPPATVKKALTGMGSAGKHQVSAVVMSLFERGSELPSVDPSEANGFDATDALAIALCHLHRRPMQEMGQSQTKRVELKGSPYAWRASPSGETPSKRPQGWWQKKPKE